MLLNKTPSYGQKMENIINDFYQKIDGFFSRQRLTFWNDFCQLF